MSKEKKLANEISDALNTFLFNQEEFNNAMNVQHRTLQQSMGRAFLGWLESIEERDERHFDARNEGLKRLADELIGDFKKKHDNIPPSKFLGYI